MSADHQRRVDSLLCDPLHGVVFARLRDRHQPVAVETGVWRSKGRHPQRCAVCQTARPCEVGQSWAMK